MIVKEFAIKAQEIIKAAIAKLFDGDNLSREESRVIMKMMMEGKITDAQISAYLVALRMKGETVDEIAGSAEAMIEKVDAVNFKYDNFVDTSGTGCDNLHTFNISTTAAFVTAGANVAVAKHGNRSILSKCGSSDILKALGVNIDISNDLVSRCFHEIGIAFLFMPKYHKSFQYALGPRREIGARTLFNVLGPITNPAQTRHQLIGVYDASLMRKLVDVMRELGAHQVMVVHGDDGLDEITITGKTRVCELIDGQVYEYVISPEDFKMKSSPISSVQSSSCEENVRYTMNVLNGEESPATDIVMLNAGAAIKVSGKVASLAEGIELARESIISGAAKRKLENLIKITNLS